MHYASQTAFAGNANEALELTATALTALGFRVLAKDAHAVELAGPGMRSTRQSALLGASHLRVEVGGGRLDVHAVLGGAERLAKFVLVFPLVLCLVLFGGLAIVFSIVLPDTGWMLGLGIAAGVNIAAWLVLGPVMARWIRRNTRRAIDALAQSVAALAAR